MALVAALASVVVAVTCASGAPSPVAQAPAPPHPPPPQAAPPPAAPGSTPPAPLAVESGADAGGAPDAAPAPQARELALPKLFAALRQLANGKRRRVRIVWLGDSHSAADFLPDAVRQPLQARFGNGGPGFVAIGLDKYRHARTIVKTEGRWRREPQNPASGSRHDDGVFGPGGVRAIPISADAKSEVRLLSGATAGAARWEILFRAAGGASATVRLDSGEERRLDARSGTPGPGASPLRRLRVESKARATLTVSAGAGAPELFGAFVESPGAGVVIDTLGINGARASTPLGWEESAFRAEIAARDPALAVIAYGTNEAASALSADRYVSHLIELVERLHRASPDADCLLLGPTDMADAQGNTLPRVPEFDAAARRAATRAGCGYFSPYEAMGGEGSIARWMAESPPLAARDRVHLTAAGYEKVGGALGSALLAAYDRSR